MMTGSEFPFGPAPMLPDPVQTELDIALETEANLVTTTTVQDASREELGGATPSARSTPEAAATPVTATPSRQHRWISSLLRPAIKLWLQSQMESVAELTVEIEAGDRQLLGGCIPQVSLAAQQAVYRGLHLSQIAVQGRDIQVNLGQVMRGKPLQLLHPVPVAVDLCLQEKDLNRSLGAPLLAGAVADLLAEWLRAAHVVGLQGHLAPHPSPHITLDDDRLTLAAPWQDAAGALDTLTLTAGLHLAGHRCLQFQQPELTYQSSTCNLAGELPPPLVEPLADFALDLGTDVELTVLQIQPGALHCQGYLWVNP